MPRVIDWPERLDALMHARRDWPFQWGRHDCVTFAADCAAVVTGRDPIGDLRGWRTARQAWEAMERQGGLLIAMGRRLREIPVGAARRGDVGLVMSASKRRLACVVILSANVVGPGRFRLEAQPRGSLVAVFEVA